MKRFHVHAHVADLTASIDFYTRLFGLAPARVEADYAKWMLDDPRLNFAISTRGGQPGVDHLGIQADDADELAALKARARSADRAMLDEGDTTCCYARSEKHWITDPQGIAWEHFHTLEDIPVFGRGAPAASALPSAPAAAAGSAARTACCAPASARTPARLAAGADAALAHTGPQERRPGCC
jgi:catechol 2,3-dioxygenase-like lactoylglutathione lyase family enzyme